MKILTLTGTRPELIKLSLIIKKLDNIKGIEHVFVYSNQNYDVRLRDIFLDELGLRRPDYTFNDVGYHAFLANAFIEFDTVLSVEKPDKMSVLGDTNSGLLSILANKRGIPIYHMEAGLRSYDAALPEETNRRIIDTVSTYQLPHTENGRENLLKEGYHKNYVFKVGNPIYEVLHHYANDLRFEGEGHVLVTFHRANNVDVYEKAKGVVDAINKIAEKDKVIVSYHPRTKDQFERHGISFSDKVDLREPMGILEFIMLEKRAKCIISDSGTCPEEATIFNVPSIIIRDYIERQELIENGSVILTGTNTEDILRAYDYATTHDTFWQVPEDYCKDNVSDTVVKLLIGR